MKNEIKKNFSEVYNYKPFKYWFSTLFVSWVALFTAAYFSYNDVLNSFKNIFILIALFTPFTAMLFMVYGSKSKELKDDFKNRIFDLKSVRVKYWLFIFFLMPIVLLLSTYMSLFFGQSTKQFLISPELTIFGGETLIILIILVLAPTFEELGFRGYGIDSLKKNRTIIKTIFVYIVLWMLWHFPLYFIDGYYQNELFHENIIYAINFVIQLSIAGFLMGWIYYKNNRSIIAMIIFHIMLNLFSVLLQTQQFTKCIITFNLLIVSGVIFYFNKNYFLEKNEK